MNQTKLCNTVPIKRLDHVIWLDLRLGLRLLGGLNGHVNQGAEEQAICDHQWIEIYLQG